MTLTELNLTVEIGGIAMPWWLVSIPDQVTTVTLVCGDGTEYRFTFESFVLASASLRVHCTWPRHASMLSTAHPDMECRWTHPYGDEAAMIAHAASHLVDVMDGEK